MEFLNDRGELTDKSLNGCIKIPKGNLDLFNSDCVFGKVVNVHLNNLQRNKHTWFNNCSCSIVEQILPTTLHPKA